MVVFNWLINVWCFSPNVVVEKLALLLLILTIQVSSLYLETCYAERIFSDFPQYLQTNAKVATATAVHIVYTYLFNIIRRCKIRIIQHVFIEASNKYNNRFSSTI